MGWKRGDYSGRIHWIAMKRRGFEPQELAASNEPIDFQIHLIDSAKNCRLVQNAMQQSRKREKASDSKKATSVRTARTSRIDCAHPHPNL
eukprot:scaffold189097_cov48-Attheya_sp.AAC.1